MIPSCRKKPTANYFEATEYESYFKINAITIKDKCEYYVVFDSDKIKSTDEIEKLGLIIRFTSYNGSIERDFSSKAFVCNWGNNLKSTKHRFARKIDVPKSGEYSVLLDFKEILERKTNITRIQIVETCVY